MEDKLLHFFNNNEFDLYEPPKNHLKRFEKKLNSDAKRSFSWISMSIAASILLFIGFGFGTFYKSNNDVGLANVSPKMREAQNFFVSAIKAEIIELEKNRNLDTEAIIESALDQIEELEDKYKIFVEELKNSGEQQKIINAMIENYQKRLEVLKNALQQIEILESNKNLRDEIYI